MPGEERPREKGLLGYFFHVFVLFLPEGKPSKKGVRLRYGPAMSVVDDLVHPFVALRCVDRLLVWL